MEPLDWIVAVAFTAAVILLLARVYNHRRHTDDDD